MKHKPTTTEKRAMALCEWSRIHLTNGGAWTVEVEHVPSRTWGYCARICNMRGDKVAHAGGCGYDKDSAVLADLLRFLPLDSQHRSALRTSSGCGVPRVVERLRDAGYDATVQHLRSGLLLAITIKKD